MAYEGSGETGPRETGLVVDRVQVDAGAVRILEGVSFVLYPGELCALIGPSGSGKSTLIKAMLGLRSPDRGRITYQTHPLAELGPVGYVPQDDAVHRALTVRQSVGYAVRLRRPELGPAEERRLVERLCTRLGLRNRLEVPIKRLSGGQRKRVSVAIELVTDPQMLVLDEPTSGLDPGLEARLMQLFADVAGAGRIVLVATHAMQSLERCDALIVLAEGRLVYFGPPGAAPAHFGASTFGGIFEALGKRSARSWAYAAHASEACTAFRNRPPACAVEAPHAARDGRVVFDRRPAAAGRGRVPGRCR